MATWLKIAKNPAGSRIRPVSRNSYGEAAVLIDDKEYRYVNVPEPAWAQLVTYARVGNLKQAFQILNSLTPDDLFKKPETNQLELF